MRKMAHEFRSQGYEPIIIEYNSTWNPLGMANEVKGKLRQYSPSNSDYFVGHSMGGIISSMIAPDYGARFGTLNSPFVRTGYNVQALYDPSILTNIASVENYYRGNHSVNAETTQMFIQNMQNYEHYGGDRK